MDKETNAILREMADSLEGIHRELKKSNKLNETGKTAEDVSGKGAGLTETVQILSKKASRLADEVNELSPWRKDLSEAVSSPLTQREKLSRAAESLKKEGAVLDETVRSLGEKLEKIIDFILEVAVNTVRADGGSLMLVEEGSGKLVVRAAAGSRKDKAVGKKIDPGRRVCGRAMQSRRSILVDEKVRSSDWFKEMKKFEDIYAGMSIPMVIRGGVIGVINLKRTQSREAFTKKDVMVMEILAADASITIENAKLQGLTG